MSKQKKSELYNQAIDSAKLGVVSMGGMAAMGALAPIAGPAAAPVVPLVGSGLVLANIGQMGKVGMTLGREIGKATGMNKSSGDKRIDRILKF
jgi:NADPH-dependent curcumin reductase CurA